jgi:hypothetical protein
MNEAILREGKNFVVKKKVSDCSRKRDDLNLANGDLYLPGLSIAFTC